MGININDGSVVFNGREQVFALKHVTTHIQKGDWVNILGPSGSGKSTFLNVLGGMIKLTSGSICVSDKDLATISANELQTYRRTEIGYIFQDYRLFEQYTVLENVMLPQWPYARRKEIEAKAKAILGDLNMDHRMQALPHELSGGEKQRTAIARAILHEPSLLLCDEPTGNLDQANRENILSILDGLNKKGITIILVTHDPEIAKWGNRLFQLRDGKLQEKELVLY